ncbi:LysM peptidoglycan-binding domain-containing protein [Candidatus Margulisiibacteriota bacterium]
MAVINETPAPRLDPSTHYGSSQCGRPSGGKTVEVEEGDSLSQLVLRHYPNIKDPATAGKIAREIIAPKNGIKNPELIQPGQTIELPPLVKCKEHSWATHMDKPGQPTVHHQLNQVYTVTPDGNLSGGTRIDTEL